MIDCSPSSTCFLTALRDSAILVSGSCAEVLAREIIQYQNIELLLLQ